jgi:hypothetical protein
VVLGMFICLRTHAQAAAAAVRVGLVARRFAIIRALLATAVLAPQSGEHISCEQQGQLLQHTSRCRRAFPLE